MVANTLEFVYENFGEGLNFRDDEIRLPIGETPFAQNIEIVKATGLQKKLGQELQYSLPSKFSIAEIFNYTDNEGRYNYVVVAYPCILLVDPVNGAFQVIDSSWVNTGEPEGWECDGRFFLVDRAPDRDWETTTT